VSDISSNGDDVVNTDISDERKVNNFMFDGFVTQDIFDDPSCFIRTCPCSSVVNALGCHVQWSMTCLRSWVQSSVLARPPSTKELYAIIPTHMMNREIIPGRKKRVCQCPIKSVTVADKIVSDAGMAEAKRHGWSLAGAAHSNS